MNAVTNGIRKAAILVSSLDESAADRVLDQMDPRQARLVRQAVIDLDDIDPREQRRVIDEFFQVEPIASRNDLSGIELDGPTARGLKTNTTIRSHDEPPQPETVEKTHFCFLREAEADKLASLLKTERPQTIALILSHLSPEQSGAVLMRFAPRFQVEVIRRLVSLEEADPEVLREVEQALELRLTEQFGMQRRRAAGLSAVAGILKTSNNETASQILSNLAAHDRTLADKLGPEPIEFDDLVRLDDATLASIQKAAGHELTVLALVGAPPELVGRFLSRMPQSEAESVGRELDNLGPVRLSDVDEARRRIARLAGRLAVEGHITLPTRQPATIAFPEKLRTAA